MITHGSTFSGIGAAEIAAEMLGWENAFHCEINPFGRQVLEYYFPNEESYEDITKTDFSKMNKECEWYTEWLCEGCDCEGCASYLPPEPKQLKLFEE